MVKWFTSSNITMPAVPDHQHSPKDWLYPCWKKSTDFLLKPLKTVRSAQSDLTDDLLSVSLEWKQRRFIPSRVWNATSSKGKRRLYFHWLKKKKGKGILTWTWLNDKKISLFRFLFSLKFFFAAAKCYCCASRQWKRLASCLVWILMH